MRKPLILVSSCLLGNEVRYDGGHSRDPIVAGVLSRLFTCQAICPESDSGLAIPRPPMRLEGDPRAPEVLVTNTGEDKTEKLYSWSEKKLDELSNLPLCGLVLKSRSPSCGILVKVFDRAGRVRKKKGAGIFAGLALERFPGLPIVSEAELSDPEALEAFVDEVFRRDGALAETKTAGAPRPKAPDPRDNPRVLAANAREINKGGYVLYWMQQAQRAEENPALELAVETADRLSLPVVAVFGLTPGYPEANLRHYAFMMEGLAETEKTLRDRGILFAPRRAEPPDAALSLAKDAAALICDTGYTKIQRRWAEEVSERAPCLALRVETDVVVPVHLASGKAEYAARTIRPKIKKQLEGFLFPCANRQPQKSALGLDVEGPAPGFFTKSLVVLDTDKSVPAATRFFPGGANRARTLLREFLDSGLAAYDAGKDRLAPDVSSKLSPYLHFGQISPVEVALAVKSFTHAPEEAREAFLEQLIVRRELAANFVFYTPDYDRYSCLPAWAQKTLALHAGDPRPYTYSPEELEAARTHDPVWNAAMREMRITGFLGNHLRMYWGKKVLEWSERPEQAFSTLLALNNRYFLDGRDPNSFAGVAWCFGMHDRPFAERTVFGMLRSMTAAGLKRKGDTLKYVERIKTISRIIHDA